MRTHRTRAAVRAAGVLTAAAAALGAIVAAPQAQAVPDPQPHFVKTIRCDSADPWPGPRLRIPVDVYTGIRFPSDGLPGPAIELRANETTERGFGLNTLQYSITTRVSWHNLATHRRGSVFTPTHGSRVTWQAVVHPGAGPVHLTVKQKIGAIAFVRMVNPQYRTCSTLVRAY